MTSVAAPPALVDVIAPDHPDRRRVSFSAEQRLGFLEVDPRRALARGLDGARQQTPEPGEARYELVVRGNPAAQRFHHRERRCRLDFDVELALPFEPEGIAAIGSG